MGGMPLSPSCFKGAQSPLKRRLVSTISLAGGVISFERCLGTGQEMAAITRRQLAAALGGTATVLPLALRAQPRAMPVIGFLFNMQETVLLSDRLSAFRRGLNEAGFAEGRNVTIEFRFAEGHRDRISVSVRGTSPLLSSRAGREYWRRAARSTLLLLL
jgi:hypothetical protein